MAHMRLPGALIAIVTTVLLASSPASAQTRFHECQHPVLTGVEVSNLRSISAARACPVALKLFRWEYSSVARQRALYGCSRPKPEAPGYPYLRLHRFRGWRLSLRGREKAFTMSRGHSSFVLGGTDFPLNCT